MKGGSIEVFLLDFQCRIKVGAIDSAATDEKKKNLLYFGCDFSGWYNFGKIIKIVAIRCHVLNLNQNAPNSISTDPRPLSWI